MAVVGGRGGLSTVPRAPFVVRAPFGLHASSSILLNYSNCVFCHC